MATGVCCVVGARPNFMKAAPVYRALIEAAPDTNVALIHTGQHYDPEMSDTFLEQLDLPQPDVFLGVGPGTHGEQTARALIGVERELIERDPALVVVTGDVNSTLAGALAAAKLGIAVAHVEAGLRSFDLTMPEEHNRKLTDHVSTLLFAHSEDAVSNLEREGVKKGVHFVGNTMIDSLLTHVDAARSRRPWELFGVEPRQYALVTLHRPALVDHPELLLKTVDGLIDLSHELPVVFPVHPRTMSRLESLDLRSRLELGGVTVCGSLDYFSFLGLEAEARVVVTDSGGVQEETSALNVPCFTLRDTTERPVTVTSGTNVVLGTDPSRIAEVPVLLNSARSAAPIPLWDGHAGARVAEVVMAFVERAAHAVR